ncbi:hypothetical protein SXIM_46250 [Streptomyces xiamenensis]|uniref:Uncharacterized protein n=1 Tax=Streptomyces xiamenensis TaxID=408015 RepID=A0A0F7G083_9ACTN|nr:hypothetical protein SXIM_46250 [Streptomyces xiamenensis]
MPERPASEPEQLPCHGHSSCVCSSAPRRVGAVSRDVTFVSGRWNDRTAKISRWIFSWSQS